MKNWLKSLMCLALIGCTAVPITGRKQLSMMSDAEMFAMSFESYAQMKDTASLMDEYSEEYLQAKRVSDKIITACHELLDRENAGHRVHGFQWEMSVIESDMANAWCMPGGKIGVYTGMYPYFDNDDEMAVVISHEVAHAIAKHGNERMSQQMLAMMGSATVGIAASEAKEENQFLYNALYGLGATMSILAYSRNHETEADKIGLVLMARAGYDLDAAVSFWEKFGQGGSNVALFSTHPASTNRLNEIKTYIPIAKSYAQWGSPLR